MFYFDSHCCISDTEMFKHLCLKKDKDKVTHNKLQVLLATFYSLI